MSMGVWLLLVGVIVVLLASGWRLQTRQRCVCYGLAMLLAYVVSCEMKSWLGVATLVVATWALIGLVCLRDTGHSPRSYVAELRREYRAWRGLGWSGTFVHPPHDRVR